MIANLMSKFINYETISYLIVGIITSNSSGEM